MKMSDIQHIIDFYRKEGCTVKVCSICNLIADIKWTEGPNDGPSFSSGMFCMCKASSSASIGESVKDWPYEETVR